MAYLGKGFPGMWQDGSVGLGGKPSEPVQDMGASRLALRIWIKAALYAEVNSTICQQELGLCCKVARDLMRTTQDLSFELRASIQNRYDIFKVSAQKRVSRPFPAR